MCSSRSREDIHSVHGSGPVAHDVSRAGRLHRQPYRRTGEDQQARLDAVLCRRGCYRGTHYILLATSTAVPAVG